MDELVKALRETDFGDTCVLCEHEDMCKGNDCIIIQAADAIENTSSAYQMMAEAYEAEVTKQRWIPVTERLPEQNGEYLVFYTLKAIPPIPRVKICSFAKNLRNVNKYDLPKNKPGFYQSDSEYGYYEITGVSHWMPLPMPPESEGK